MSNQIDKAISPLADQIRTIVIADNSTAKTESNKYWEALAKQNKGYLSKIPDWYSRALKKSRKIEEYKKSGKLIPKKKIVLPVVTYEAAQKVFWKYFVQKALDGDSKKFIPTEKFKSNVPKLIKYFIGHESGLNPQKGICLVSVPGTGKTHIMESIQAMLKELEFPVFEFVKADYLCDVEVRNGGVRKRDDCFFGTRYFDDVGAEDNPVFNDYGNNVNVMGSILKERYTRFRKYGQITHMSTNEGQEGIQRIYGDRVYDRCKQMFNMVSTGEKSLRK